MISTLRKKVVRFFFNWWYRKHPPEMVKYWQRSQMSRAKVIRSEDGSMKMEIEGEKYPYPGFPRAHVLMGSLAKLKNKVKNSLFNDVFEEMQKCLPDMIPPEKMAPSVRELWRVMEELENAEVSPDMKGRITLIKKVLCFFFQEDDAYRMRWQWVMERLNLNKVKLTKEDKYYFRGKFFKVDHSIYDY